MTATFCLDRTRWLLKNDKRLFYLRNNSVIKQSTITLTQRDWIMDRTTRILLVIFVLIPAMAGAQQTQAPIPAPPSPAIVPVPDSTTSAIKNNADTTPQSLPKTPIPDTRTSAAKNNADTMPSSPAKIAMRGQPDESASPGTGLPNQGSAWISPQPQSPATVVPLAYPATRIEIASRVEDLIRDAATLRTQGNLSKAMELYNEAITLAPRYAETYRQRALTLLRLGDRVQAQIDYGRFLELDPQAQPQVKDEIQLFAQSGYARVGETEVALNTTYSTSLPAPPPAASLPPSPFGTPVVALVAQPAAYNPAKQSDLNYSIARDDFQRGNYNGAYQWALRANEAMPQARIHALMGQILFAQGFYSGAASEARAAVAMAPSIDWTTLYGFYDYKMPQFSAQFRALEDYVRQNPSSSDARFLLGYEHLILGQADMAHAQMSIAAVLEPVDVVPISVLARDGVEIVGGRELMTKNMQKREGISFTGETATATTEAPPQPHMATAPTKTEVK
jgi:tetratricopeptide (TPR) repeat protein